MSQHIEGDDISLTKAARAQLYSDLKSFEFQIIGMESFTQATAIATGIQYIRRVLHFCRAGCKLAELEENQNRIDELGREIRMMGAIIKTSHLGVYYPVKEYLTRRARFQLQMGEMYENQEGTAPYTSLGVKYLEMIRSIPDVGVPID